MTGTKDSFQCSASQCCFLSDCKYVYNMSTCQQYEQVVRAGSEHQNIKAEISAIHATFEMTPLKSPVMFSAGWWTFLIYQCMERLRIILEQSAEFAQVRGVSHLTVPASCKITRLTHAYLIFPASMKRKNHPTQHYIIHNTGSLSHHLEHSRFERRTSHHK